MATQCIEATHCFTSCGFAPVHSTSRFFIFDALSGRWGNSYGDGSLGEDVPNTHSFLHFLAQREPQKVKPVLVSARLTHRNKRHLGSHADIPPRILRQRRWHSARTASHNAFLHLSGQDAVTPRYGLYTSSSASRTPATALVPEPAEGLCHCHPLSFGHRAVGLCLVRHGRSNGHLGRRPNLVLYDAGFEGEGDVPTFQLSFQSIAANID
jgi:hypothetical protein